VNLTLHRAMGKVWRAKIRLLFAMREETIRGMLLTGYLRLPVYSTFQISGLKD
jgi:hypothetical protein